MELKFLHILTSFIVLTQGMHNKSISIEDKMWTEWMVKVMRMYTENLVCPVEEKEWAVEWWRRWSAAHWNYLDIWKGWTRENWLRYIRYYLRGGCGVNRMYGESNENVCRKFGMSSRGEGMSCGVVEMVKCSTLRWFGHLERMNERELTKRIKLYRSKIDAGNVRGRPPIKWEWRSMWEDAGVRGLEDVRVRCMDRCKWRLL